ncbi:MAG: CYTH domain-containing protein [Sphaerochaeta sp.]|nr:CYTH domain-containing protein [Sphaerochaeta sp.]
MNMEVELKAHVSDYALLKKRLESLTGISACLCEYKQDTYFSPKGEDSHFRMRLEQKGPSFDSMQGTLVFTYKNKERTDGIEVNEEVEFTASSDQGAAALQFFLSMGYEIYITKTKRGYVYTYTVCPELPLMTVELVEVVGLGWFIEMEFVLENSSKVELAREKLLHVLDRVGVDRSSIEDEYYMHMLKKKKPEA